MSNPDETRLPENDRIKELIPISEIAAMMETGDYSAEMLLQHLCTHWNRRNGWHPIETLPRDGTPVLVWADSMHTPDIAWHDEQETTLRSYTHWRPLPSLPC